MSFCVFDLQHLVIEAFWLVRRGARSTGVALVLQRGGEIRGWHILSLFYFEISTHLSKSMPLVGTPLIVVTMNSSSVRFQRVAAPEGVNLSATGV